MAIITRFQTNTRGALYLTGNTLGLSGNNGVPSAIGNVGAFITTSTTLPTPTGWGAIVNVPAGENTTLNWQENSSSAFLNLPAGAAVLYAELIWASAIRNETQDLSSLQNTNITLMAPDGTTTLIAPDPASSQTVTVTGPIVYMTRSNSITSIIQQKGNGKYTVYGVPAARSGSSACCAGWTIVIAYNLSSDPYRSLNIYTACEGITGSTSATVTVTGFSTPRIGSVAARALIGGLEGDPNGSGDQALFGPNTSSLTALSGPRNPSGNFFQAQICDNLGALDTTGTFGTRNQPLGSLASGVRQGWDITNVDASGILPNNQTSAVFRFASTSEVYAANMVALQINVDSADLSGMNKGGDKAFVVIGDTLTYTITIPNTGTTTASNIVFIDTVPNGTSFLNGSVIINGSPNSLLNPQAPGFSVTDIAANGVSTVSFRVTIDTVPSPNPIPNKSFVSYTFLPGIASTIPVSSSNESTTFNSTYVTTTLTSTKYVDKSYATIGDVIKYTVVLTNTGTTSSRNILFVDTIPNGTELVAGTFNQDGTSIATSPNPPGTTLPNVVGINSVSTVTFNVRVTTVASPNPIPNTAAMTYYYAGSGISLSNSTNTNTVNTAFNYATLKGIVKYVDKSYATCGDTINYTIVIPNTGNVTAQNVMFKDTIPNGTSLVANSVYINGNQSIGANPSIGVTIPNISAGTTATLTFSVKVQC